MEKAGGCQDSQGSKLDKVRLFSALANSMQRNRRKKF